VPGSWACPRDCDAPHNNGQCAEAAKELGLPCGTTINKVVTKTSGQNTFSGLLEAANVTFSGSVVISAADGAVTGTELMSLSWVDGQAQLQQTVFSNRTDAVQTEIAQAWAQAPSGQVTLTFKDACAVSSVNGKTTMGGCSWTKGSGLNFNNYTEAGRHDVWPWEQVPTGKLLIPGEGANAFRICKCTKMPKYVAVMHSKCAPSCRRGYDPCTQHSGCKRINDWDKCKAAAQELEWVPMRGGGPVGVTAATPVGSGRDALAEWNAQFTESAWLSNRGTSSLNADTPTQMCSPTLTTGCLNNPIWNQNSAVSEWTTAGLTGGRDRWYQYLNSTVSTFPAAALSQTQWMSYKTSSLQVFPPPGLNFIGDTSVRHIPQQAMPPPSWSPYWAPIAPFLTNGFDLGNGEGQPGAKLRPEGCTFRHDETTEPDTFFWPWNTLRLSTTSNDEVDDACCPAGTNFGVDCFVTNCTVQPCLDWQSGGTCSRQTSEVKDTFALCECTEDNSHSNDECIFFGQPCGAGQACSDPDPNSEPDPQNPQYQCSCLGGGMTMGGFAIGTPASCPDEDSRISYVAKPAGRDCGSCNRVTSISQCNAAAAAIGLSDTTASMDPAEYSRTRPCGCHYSELDGVCSGPSGECLRFNDAIGDAVYDGCQAYEPADAHDFLICACYESVPKYVAAPVVACPTSCDPVVSKADCRTAAEYIGMHLALHEEKEALLLLNGELVPSKLHDYTGLDNNTYQHNDDGLGPVVGDAPSVQANRPPGCHYRRRHDADVLPAGTSVNWPHLLFNPKQDSTAQATTQDMMICRCPGAEPLAPTPAPTATAAAWAARLGLVSAGVGPCRAVDGYAELSTPFQATFHTCADLCMASTSCEAVNWFMDSARTFDTEGLGECKHYQCTTTGPCPSMTVDASGSADNLCYQKPGPTPAPTPAPSMLPSVGCYHFCCQQMSREACCADPNDCEHGGGGYCAWTNTNLCERNHKDRGDMVGASCAHVEINFNVTHVNFTASTDLSALSAQVATDAVILTGSPLGSFVPLSEFYDKSANLFTVDLKCPDGGCGNFSYIAESLCPAGTEISLGMRSAAISYPVGRCLLAGTLTEQNPMNLFGGPGLQPVFVRTKQCQCIAGLANRTVDLGNAQILGSNMALNYVREVVGGGARWVNSTIEPAFTNSPAVNQLCQIPDFLRGYTHFRMQHSVPVGASFEFHCPEGCGVCDLFVFQFHDPPCSSDYNARYPALLTADGWSPSKCAPRLCGVNNGQPEVYKTVGYRKQVQSGSNVTMPPVETACLSYFGLFAGEGVFCEDNTLQEEAACNNAGGLCKWTGQECVSEWCPSSTASGGGPLSPCTSPDDLECASPLTSQALQGILDLM